MEEDSSAGWENRARALKGGKRREERFEQELGGGGICCWCDHAGQRHQGGPRKLELQSMLS